MDSFAPDRLQRIALSLMSVLVLLTFALTNLQAVLWQSSDWLVGAVLPSVVVNLTNEERSDLAAPTLRRNSTLDQAAALKAQHMASNGYFAHFAPDGTSPWYWFDQAGYSYAHAGENLAIHFTDSEEVVEAWMNSPTHRANIVDRKFTEIGVGTARGRYDGHNTVYVVQLFGAPAVVPPVQNTNVANAQAATVADPAPTVVDTNPAVAAAEVDTQTMLSDAPEAESAPVKPAEPTTNEKSESESEPLPMTELAALETPTATEVASNPVQQSMVATSSGLATAETVTPLETQPVSFLALATQPNTVMQVVYTLIALAVFVLLILSFVNELKHAHPVQMAYSVALLLLMTGLYVLHTNLTDGAIVV